MQTFLTLDITPLSGMAVDDEVAVAPEAAAPEAAAAAELPAVAGTAATAAAPEFLSAEPPEVVRAGRNPSGETIAFNAFNF